MPKRRGISENNRRKHPSRRTGNRMLAQCVPLSNSVCMCPSVLRVIKWILAMETLSSGVHIKRNSLFEFWRSVSCKGRICQMIDFIKSKFDALELTDEEERQLRALMKNENEKFRVKWESKQRKLDLFIHHYQGWLSENVYLCMIPEPARRVMVRGRPTLSFESSSKRTKNRKIQPLLKEFSKEEITYAAQASLRSSGKRDAADLIQEVSISSPTRATTYKKARKRLLSESNKSDVSEKKFRPYSAEDALALFIGNNLTVQTYKNIQQEAKERGCPLYPCYDHLARVKKECFPPVDLISVSDTWAEVQLQALLDHTATRTCKNILGEELLKMNNTKNFTLLYKWGCDGSSGHSIYKQRFENADSTDEYMFVISMVPLRLVNDNDKVIWENPRPSSPRFCRIIKFIYAKETEKLIIEQCQLMENNIKLLTPTQININDSEINVRHHMILSMIDGKVCNVLSENRNSQSCFICKASSREMNLSIQSKESNSEMYKFGISSLHAYIRSMECLLNIAYRMDFKEWQARGPERQALKKQRKEDIKKKFKEVGLIVDKVNRQTTSNDGNTAKAFFQNSSTTARITNLNEDLIKRFGIILSAIACGYQIDADKFQIYCTETRRLYLDLYHWYNMPATRRLRATWFYV